MSIIRYVCAVAVCAAASSPAHALLSINVLQDDTTVPGWVINTFTVDSDTDLTAAVALSRLNSGSMLQVPGIFGAKRSNGPGDSYFSINNDALTIAGLGAGDLGSEDAIFDSTGISQTWLNTRTSDIGLGMHLATLTFSGDTSGSLEFITTAGDFRTTVSYGLTDGIATAGQIVRYEPKPPDPDPLPNPGGDPPPNPGGNPGSGGNPPNPGPSGTPGGNTIPEPAGLGLVALAAAVIGGLHRKRPVTTNTG